MKVTFKNRLQNVIFLLVILKSCLCFSQIIAPKKIIVIDPGHGGMDPGALGVLNVREKDVVLNLAKEIVQLNKSVLDSRFEIHLTRHNDTLIALKDRSQFSKRLKADVFLSLHCNAALNFAYGMEAYVLEKASVNGNYSLNLASSLLKEVNHNLGFKNRGVKYSNFQVLRDTAPFCTSVLLEIGFITHDKEAAYFLRSKNTRAMALAILMGLLKS
ncbi:N-acetylmuramoyl-L-alanine amidase [Tamlana sp. I1]|uniref:N-acetylmuramoyl-L-alanine amidase family protein n=1 Tax=Tamlana sp. I1 TaxID=2762061 RepID=UPI0018900942|nr:N-acetylmuramoyl-L-alanine amidase [Tamlana sp. I1]